MNERQMRSKYGKVDSSKALDASLVVTECSGTKSDKQDTISRSGNDITHAMDADIRPVNDQVSFDEVKLTAQHNVLSNEQQHYVQSEPIYDTHLLEKTVENANLKAQIQEKGFANVAFKNELRKLKGNSVDTKFAKPSILEKQVQSLKTRNNIKPVQKITNVIKPKMWISKGYRISPNKSSSVHEKLNTPRSCLRWKPTGRIFTTAGLRWIPTGKMFTDSITKVDNEPPNGSNEDITNPYECEQTLNVSASTLNLSASTSFNPKKE
ncbi:hypothetical protein Tco_0308700 [Tanacetum coccineum]